MQAFLEYIQANYIWYVLGLIIILLAIIGYYADQTNFGQGKQDDDADDKLKDIDIKNKRINDLVTGVTSDEEVAEETNDEMEEEKQQKKKSKDKKKNKKAEEETVDKVEADKAEENLDEELNKEEKNQTFEDAFQKFDEEFDSVVPKKDLINEDLINDIDNLSLDKTQKFKFTDIPDLDDVDLPEIKQINKQEEDIWKF